MKKRKTTLFVFIIIIIIVLMFSVIGIVVLYLWGNQVTPSLPDEYQDDSQDDRIIFQEPQAKVEVEEEVVTSGTTVSGSSSTTIDVVVDEEKEILDSLPATWE